MDQNDAIADCGSNETSFSPLKLVFRSKYQFSDKRIMRVNACPQTYFKTDCDTKWYLTKVNNKQSYHFKVIYFERDIDVSFAVVSKPRIDNIEFVTFILGALGSWIGFSFVGINPIPHLLQIDGNQINHKNGESNNQQIKRELIRVTQDSKKMKVEMESIKNDKIRNENTIELLKQAMIDIMYRIRDV